MKRWFRDATQEVIIPPGGRVLNSVDRIKKLVEQELSPAPFTAADELLVESVNERRMRVAHTLRFSRHGKDQATWPELTIVLFDTTRQKEIFTMTDSKHAKYVLLGGQQAEQQSTDAAAIGLLSDRLELLEATLELSPTERYIELRVNTLLVAAAERSGTLTP